MYSISPLIYLSEQMQSILMEQSFQAQYADYDKFHHIWMGEFHKKEKPFIITLPDNTEFLDQAIFPLHRKIERLYKALPWPSKINKVVILTEVQGGRGDIAAAARAISLFQKINPSAIFDWVLVDGFKYGPPISFLTCDATRIHARPSQAESNDKEAADFMLAGPLNISWGKSYTEKRIGRKIAGPIFNFQEIAQDLKSFYYSMPQIIARNTTQEASDKIYHELHATIFPSESDSTGGLLPMGAQEGTGVFTDRSRLEAPLSRGYCCPTYILQIQDLDLRNDILKAMNVSSIESIPDYDRFSFNSGYAHHLKSKGKFIDCVSIHERQKNVVTVLNHGGEFDRSTIEEFHEQIFTKDRLALLKSKGYGRITFCGSDFAITHQLSKEETSRSLTLIVRKSFSPQDMRNLQLASERLLATGDNSALEAWCARCILYLYEDVDNAGCKWRFLQQQVDFAKRISPNLSSLLALFGNDRRLPSRSYEESIAAMEKILGDPHLSKATLTFCKTITKKRSFNVVLEGALKRAVWHYLVPELVDVEARLMDKEFREGLITYLRDPKTKETRLVVKAIPEIDRQIKRIVASRIS